MYFYYRSFSITIFKYKNTALLLCWFLNLYLIYKPNLCCANLVVSLLNSFSSSTVGWVPIIRIQKNFYDLIWYLTWQETDLLVKGLILVMQSFRHRYFSKMKKINKRQLSNHPNFIKFFFCLTDNVCGFYMIFILFFSGRWKSKTNIASGTASPSPMVTRNLPCPTPLLARLWLHFSPVKLKICNVNLVKNC
jgi:hypothetical protein